MPFDVAVKTKRAFLKHKTDATSGQIGFFDRLDVIAKMLNKQLPRVMVDPTKIDKEVRVPTAIAIAIDPTKIKNKVLANHDGLKFVIGNGAMKDKIPTNVGDAFEKSLYISFKNYVKTGEANNIVSAVLPKLNLRPMETIKKVDDTGKQNNARPLDCVGEYIFASNKDGTVTYPNFDIGEVLSDVTLVTSAGRRIYLSAKFSDKVSIANLGITRRIKFSEHGEIRDIDPLMTAFFNAVGIDRQKFSHSMNNYYYSNVANADVEFVPAETVKGNKTPMLDVFIQSIFGWGYYYVHGNASGIKVFEMDRERAKKISKVKKVEIRYGNSAAKEVSVNIETAAAIIKARFRNTSGKFIPNMFTIDYEFKKS